jgi:hypothetical protein
MRRALVALWAAAGLLCLLAGCSGNTLVQGLLAGGVTPNGDRVYAGSLDVVAQQMQGKLTNLGLHVSRTDQTGVVRLSSTTASGAQFCLVLTEEQTNQGEKRVRMRLEWQGNHDDQAGLQILAFLDKQ